MGKNWLHPTLCYKLLQNIFCKKMSLKNTTKFLISIIPSNTEIRFLRTLCFVLNLLSKSSKVHLWLCCIITKNTHKIYVALQNEWNSTVAVWFSVFQTWIFSVKSLQLKITGKPGSWYCFNLTKFSQNFSWITIEAFFVCSFEMWVSCELMNTFFYFTCF